MSSFNESNFMKKLENVTSSQDSIQTLSLWVLHHRNHYKKIVDHWLKCYIKAKSDHQLALFYLANDIVQHAKRKNMNHYLNEFMNALREAAKITNDEKIMNSINRVLNIWQERSVYSREFINELRELLCGEKIKAEIISKIIADFSLNDVLQQINNVLKIEQITRLKYQSLVNCKVDFANSDLLNKLKDKSYGEQFRRELDEATKCLESTILAIEKEISTRKTLLTNLEKSRIFYAIQMKEAKNIAETFNNCEVRLKQVQQKLLSRGHQLSSSLDKPTEMSTSQLSSVLSFIKQAHNNTTNVSSLDQRLTSLMSGTGQFSLNLDQAPYSQSNRNYNNPIQSVITTRTEIPSSENFETTDMDLGDSEDEDRQQQVSMPFAPGGMIADNKSMAQTLSFITGQDLTAQLLPSFELLPPPPPPPMPPSFETFLNSSSLDSSSTSNNDLDTFRSPHQHPHQHHHSNLISVDNISNDSSMRNTSNRHSSNRNHSSSNYHHHSSGHSSWRSSGSDRHSKSSYSNTNSRHSGGGNRWKNGSGGGGSWKRSNYDHY